jgi:hypothetical protein
MRTFAKGSLAVLALAVAVLAVAQVAAAQAPRASDKARGYYGPAASPDPVDAIWLAPGVNGQAMVAQPRARSFSYAPSAAAQPMRSVAPAAPQARPIPAAPAAPRATTTVTPRQFSYQPAPIYRAPTWQQDRVLRGNPANRDAAAKAQGEY